MKSLVLSLQPKNQINDDTAGNDLVHYKPEFSMKFHKLLRVAISPNWIGTATLAIRSAR
jgi:hypothetical protein